MIIYTVGVEHRGGPGEDQVVVTPVCAYTSKEEAEKHVQSLQHDLFGDAYYFWDALEVKERYEPDDDRSDPQQYRNGGSHKEAANAGTQHGHTGQATTA